MTDRENAVERHLREMTERHGSQCIKVSPDYVRGLPDRLILLPDRRVVWVETKRPKDSRVAAAQKARHVQLRKLGHDVHVVFTKEQADALIKELFGVVTVL